LALLNAASDAFVAAPTPAAAPSLRGSNAAIAQAPHDMIQGRRSEFLCLKPDPLSLVHCVAESIGYSLVTRETCQILANSSHQAQTASSNALPAIACGGAVAAAAVAAQRTGGMRMFLICGLTWTHQLEELASSQQVFSLIFSASVEVRGIYLSNLSGRQSRTSTLPTSVVQVKELPAF